MAEYNKRTPDWVAKRLRFHGTNPYGENIYRVIWSETRLSWANGEQVLEYAHLRPQWILEKWLAPEKYGLREAWEQMTDPETGKIDLGPYPERGDWEHSYSFGGILRSTGAWEVTPLCQTSIDLICRLIEAGMARYNNAQRMEAIKAAKERTRKAWRDRVAAEFHDAQDAFDGKAFSGAVVSASHKADDVKLRYTTADLPDWLPKTPGFSQVAQTAMAQAKVRAATRNKS